MNIRLVGILSFFVFLGVTTSLWSQTASLRPIPNSEFYGKPTTCRVTERFEIYDPHSLEELQKVKQMGFDQVILDRAPLHTLATQVGLDVVIANWWTPETKESIIQDSLKLSEEVAPGRLRGISLMDEPERNTPAVVPHGAVLFGEESTMVSPDYLLDVRVYVFA
ncbi:MAG: hypothetical protein AAF394_08040, partial [Planctomycetota bacterium]